VDAYSDGYFRRNRAARQRCADGARSGVERERLQRRDRGLHISSRWRRRQRFEQRRRGHGEWHGWSRRSRRARWQIEHGIEWSWVPLTWARWAERQSVRGGSRRPRESGWRWHERGGRWRQRCRVWRWWRAGRRRWRAGDRTDQLRGEGASLQRTSTPGLRRGWQLAERGQGLHDRLRQRQLRGGVRGECASMQRPRAAEMRRRRSMAKRRRCLHERLQRGRVQRKLHAGSNSL
jgi:hypothetical protein